MAASLWEKESFCHFILLCKMIVIILYKWKACAHTVRSSRPSAKKPVVYTFNDPHTIVWREKKEQHNLKWMWLCQLRWSAKCGWCRIITQTRLKSYTRWIWNILYHRIARGTGYAPTVPATHKLFARKIWLEHKRIECVLSGDDNVKKLARHSNSAHFTPFRLFAERIITCNNCYNFWEDRKKRRRRRWITTFYSGWILKICA